jgi:hypothetical protein
MFQDPKKTEFIRYEVQVSGRLSPEWSAWFGDMTVTVEQRMDGQTCTRLSGTVADQAALFGILTRIRDLGLRLIALNALESGMDNGTHNESYQEVQNEHEPAAQTK